MILLVIIYGTHVPNARYARLHRAVRQRFLICWTARVMGPNRSHRTQNNENTRVNDFDTGILDLMAGRHP